MRAVFAAAISQMQQLDRVELVVAVGVADAIQAVLGAVAAVDHHVQAVERPQQALGRADLSGDFFDLDFLCRKSAA